MFGNLWVFIFLIETVSSSTTTNTTTMPSPTLENMPISPVSSSSSIFNVEEKKNTHTTISSNDPNEKKIVKYFYSMKILTNYDVENVVRRINEYTLQKLVGAIPMFNGTITSFIESNGACGEVQCVDVLSSLDVGNYFRSPTYPRVITMFPTSAPQLRIDTFRDPRLITTLPTSAPQLGIVDTFMDKKDNLFHYSNDANLSSSAPTTRSNKSGKTRRATTKKHPKSSPNASMKHNIQSEVLKSTTQKSSNLSNTNLNKMNQKTFPISNARVNNSVLNRKLTAAKLPVETYNSSTKNTKRNNAYAMQRKVLENNNASTEKLSTAEIADNARSIIRNMFSSAEFLSFFSGLQHTSSVEISFEPNSASSEVMEEKEYTKEFSSNNSIVLHSKYIIAGALAVILVSIFLSRRLKSRRIFSNLKYDNSIDDFTASHYDYSFTSKSSAFTLRNGSTATYSMYSPTSKMSSFSYASDLDLPNTDNHDRNDGNENGNDASLCLSLSPALARSPESGAFFNDGLEYSSCDIKCTSFMSEKIEGGDLNASSLSSRVQRNVNDTIGDLQNESFSEISAASEVFKGLPDEDDCGSLRSIDNNDHIQPKKLAMVLASDCPIRIVAPGNEAFRVRVETTGDLLNESSLDIPAASDIFNSHCMV